MNCYYKNMEIGLDQKARTEITDKLRDFLATTYALYLKTQNFHWNLVGPDFFALHLLFEKHYEEMAGAIDEIAERVRSLGAYADGSFSALQKRSEIAESNKAPTQDKMIEELLKGHETLSRMGRPLIRKFQEMHDDVTSDLLIKRLAFHEKAAWMLRSHLEK